MEPSRVTVPTGLTVRSIDCVTGEVERERERERESRAEEQIAMCLRSLCPSALLVMYNLLHQ